MTTDNHLCPKCGYEMEWQECESCEDGIAFEHDCGEDTCACLEPENNVECSLCMGKGGWWVCPNSKELCEKEAASRKSSRSSERLIPQTPAGVVRGRDKQ